MIRKIHSSFALLALASLFIVSCEEEPPAINFDVPVPSKDTSYMDNSVVAGDQPKNVLIEDFTGVNCPNCPRAQTKAKEIYNANPGRIVVVAIHPGEPLFNDLTTPFNSPPHVSKYNFRTSYGKDILLLNGNALGLPAGAINRKKFAGENSVTVINYANWPTYAGQELAAGSPVKLEFKTILFDSVTRKLKVRVKLTYSQLVNDTNLLTIGLMEDSLIDVQKDVFTYIDEYEHDHVLRRLITPYTGEEITVTKPVGRVYEREYEVKLDNAWNFRKMEVYALVSKNSDEIEVIQTVKAKIWP
ncbi:MAG: Omp28-related outer membrane protein [Bacteroidia bacterium]|nr:Omp28-related outer membrane protein [Bacteroidia bacterium]